MNTVPCDNLQTQHPQCVGRADIGVETTNRTGNSSTSNSTHRFSIAFLNMGDCQATVDAAMCPRLRYSDALLSYNIHGVDIT